MASPLKMLESPTEGLSMLSIMRTLLFLSLLGILMRMYWLRRRVVKLLDQIPSYKLRFYHILGHVHYFVHHRIFRGVVSADVYDFEFFLSMHKLFPKDSMLSAWQFYNPVVTVFRADSVEIVLNHSKELKKAWFYTLLHPWLGTGLLTSHDAKWKSRRKMLTPAFHFNILKDFLPVFNKQSNVLTEVLKNHEEDEYVDITTLITRCSFDIICESILGVKVHAQTEETNPYVKAVTTLTRLTFRRNQMPWLWSDFLFKITPMGRKYVQSNEVVQSFTLKLIQDKKAEKLKLIEENSNVTPTVKDDNFQCNKRALLDLLLDEHINNNSITAEEIKEEVNTFAFEGHDTTAMGMSWSLYLIGLHPEVQTKVHAELDSIFGDDERDATVEDLKSMKYLECVLKETLRLYPSVPVFGREIREDIEFEDRTIPKGSTCIVFAYMLHRNPEVFPNPESFDPERFTPENSAGRHPFAYVPFSAGPRNCIGQRFALMEEKTVVSAILRKYKVTSLDPRDKVQVVDFLVLRPERKLRIKIAPRK